MTSDMQPLVMVFCPKVWPMPIVWCG